jgi:hypothetical protein
VSILTDLENLLREIAEQQQPGAGRPAAPQQRPPQRPPEARPAAPKPATPPIARLRPGDLEPVEVLDAEIVDAVAVRGRSAIGQRAEKRQDTSVVTVAASRRATEVGQGEEKDAAHFHDKFDQQSSRIDDPDDKVGAAAGAAFATRIAEMFRNPQSIQQAFILNEILNRPNFRW